MNSKVLSKKEETTKLREINYNVISHHYPYSPHSDRFDVIDVNELGRNNKGKLIFALVVEVYKPSCTEFPELPSIYSPNITQHFTITGTCQDIRKSEYLNYSIDRYSIEYVDCDGKRVTNDVNHIPYTSNVVSLPILQRNQLVKAIIDYL